MDLNSSSLQGQPPNHHQVSESTTNSSAKCSKCNKPADNIATIKCLKCSFIFHLACANIQKTNQHNPAWLCSNCSDQTQTTVDSATSIRSRSSVSSHAHRQALDLQRLQEETQLEREFIRKKYQILERAEDDHDDARTINSSVHEWLDNQLNAAPPNPFQQLTSKPQTINISAINEEHYPSANEVPYSTIPHSIISTNLQNSSNPITTYPNVSTSLVFTPAIQPISTTTTFNNDLISFFNNTSNYLHSTTANVHNFSKHTTNVENHSTKAPAPRFGNNYPMPSVCPTSAAQQATPHNLTNMGATFALHAASTTQAVPPETMHQSRTTQTAPPVTDPTFPRYLSPNFWPSNKNDRRLSQQQINARQSVPKELPIFSGTPEEWPLFSSTYDWSTSVCGLTDAENLLRLQKSLRGEALRSVQHILIHPYGVPCAIATLKLLYGQPEKILNSLKNRIKSMPAPNMNKLNTITSFAVEVKGLETTIKACGLLDELNNSSLLHELIMKMPTYFQLNWGEQKIKLIKNNQKVSLTDFSNWIFEVGVSATSINVESNSHMTSSAEQNTRKTRNAFINTHEIKSKKDCVICSADCSSVAKCAKFLDANRNEKWNLIRKHNLCKQCLKRHNGVCNSRIVCAKQGCNIKHNTLLHRSSDNETVANKTDENEKIIDENKNKTSSLHTAHSDNICSEILFKIIPIIVYGKNNKTVSTFAFIDEGSSISLVNEQLMNKLNLTGDSQPLCLKWTGNMTRNEEDSQVVSMQISGNNTKKFYIHARTVKHLSLPSQSLNYDMLSERFPHLRGLPIDSFSNAVPDLLIGLNNLKLCVPRKVREGNKNEPVAICTSLGWLLCGNSHIGQNFPNQFNFHSCDCEREDDKKLSSLLKQFYSTEMTGIGSATQLLGKDDQRAIEILEKNTRHRYDGHYEVALLWRYDDIKLPQSFDMAKKRLHCLEKTLRKNKDLLKIFEKTINEYLEKKYIRKVDPNEMNKQNVWYLPIFAVFNKNKPNKTRIVWDAAAKVSGVSLNSMLLKGPDLFASLPSILFRFRQKQVAVCGDIEQMFHQIHIRNEDCHAQRFLWRGCDESIEPEVYVMEVMIFGASCAPCTSQYVKNLNASKFEAEYSSAADAIKYNHYVDDFLASTDTADEAIKLAREVRFIHSQGGFNIRNWCSNSHTVLNALQSDMSAGNICINIGAETDTEKILGVFWMPADDIITFKLSPNIFNSQLFLGNKEPTKREVLKILMSIYDPLGLVGNFLMHLKIILQDIWRSGVEWDEPILEEQLAKWKNWISFLPSLKDVNIPRCYLQTLKNYNYQDVQLHIFVDASQSGYAAVAYLRITDGDNVVVSLVGSKTRVAPLKVVSIPRLELMAAVIGARFAKFIVESHTININKKIFWSDSRTVLSWIRSDHRKYHQFVAVRVSEILDITEINEWFWISTKANVADEATKYSKAPNLSATSRWLNGPEFLKLPENTWPNKNEALTTTDIELKECNLSIQTVEPFINIERFSRWTRALRAVAFVVRFIYQLKNKGKKLDAMELSQEELCKAEIILIKDTQKLAFYNEIECVLQNKKLSKSNFMYKLSPYLDDKGVLRVGGRIDFANVPDELKHPAILPKHSRLTTLIIWHYHNIYRHSSNETVVNEIRQRYYIPRLRVACKSVIKQCQTCKIKNASPVSPQMARLPRARLGAYHAPFTFTGIDYFGPMFVTVNRHKEKRYGALFTCLTVRAVHVEIVHSLNTSSCIMAIRKFISRRGQPREFYSDNGTNFVGADRELREALSEIDKDELVRNFTNNNTKWNFNPPSAPHMGGAWERLVRSVKNVFYKIKIERFPNDETLQSIMAEVENIINSRPLTYVPVESEYDEAITPNHFLLGNSNGLKPLASYEDDGVLLRESWLCSQQYAQKFWKSWVAEYLPTLTCRSKWCERAGPLAVGDLVVVVDPANPRNVWPRGRIIEVTMSEDGQVRKAKVVTKCGILERPAVKLAILDVTG